MTAMKTGDTGLFSRRSPPEECLSVFGITKLASTESRGRDPRVGRVPCWNFVRLANYTSTRRLDATVQPQRSDGDGHVCWTARVKHQWTQASKR